MKFFISIIFFTILFSQNINAEVVNKNFQKEVMDFIEGKTDVTPSPFKTDNNFGDKKIQDLLKKADRLKNSNNTSNETTDFLKKLRPFIVPILIVLYLIFRNESDTKSPPKQKIKPKNNSSRIEEFIKKANEKNKNKKNNKEKERLDEEYEDEWNYDEHVEDHLIKIDIKENKFEDILVLDVMAIGQLNFTTDQIKQSEKENKEAKFSCYVFDITDADNEIPLQGLTESFKDDSYLLCSSRNIKVEYGSAYNEWTAMFRFPKSLVVPPNRGKRKLKFIISATKIKATFEQGKVKNDKDLYFEVETLYDLNFDEPGYLESVLYENDLNEKIVQLGMAVAYSEKKINQQGVEAIKSWINRNMIFNNYFSEDTEIEKDNKIKYSFLLQNTFELLKRNKLSLSEIVKEINYKSNISRRYDAMDLLLNIAGSDDRLSKEEDKLLNNTARALELDLNRFQQMKTSTIANIETIDENSEDNEDTIFNFSKDMTSEDKCKKLREEYTRWNRQTNNSNEKIRNQARKMVELTASLRKKYNC